MNQHSPALVAVNGLVFLANRLVRGGVPVPNDIRERDLHILSKSYLDKSFPARLGDVDKHADRDDKGAKEYPDYQPYGRKASTGGYYCIQKWKYAPKSDPPEYDQDGRHDPADDRVSFLVHEVSQGVRQCIVTLRANVVFLAVLAHLFRANTASNRICNESSAFLARSPGYGISRHEEESPLFNSKYVETIKP